MLTFEGTQIVGAAAIVEKLTVSGRRRVALCSLLNGLCFYGFHPQSLPFAKVAHKVTTTDAQPSSATSLIVSVTGLLLVSLLLPCPQRCSLVPSNLCAGRRQCQPTSIQPGLPAHPRWCKLLRVSFTF